jgi:hypothetical protein
MTRQFAGKINRRDAMGAVGVACVGASASPHSGGPKTIGPMGSPKRDGYTPQPEIAQQIQTFTLNFTDADSNTVVASRLAATLKALGHSYPDHDLGTIATTIVMTHRSDMAYEDGVMGLSWCRPQEGHLKLDVRLTRECPVADLSRGWMSKLLG